MRYFLFIIIQLFFITAKAQNLQEMSLPELDTTQYQHETSLKPVFTTPNLSFQKFDLTPIKLLSFDFNNIFKIRYSRNYSLNTAFFLPNLKYAESYKINDKLSLSSAYFFTNSFMDMPIVGAANNNYEIKSMFINYKVTPKVTISVGTHVVVKKDPFK